MDQVVRNLVVIPALNEARSIGDTLARLDVLEREAFDVLVVDDGSTDETAAIVNAAARTVCRRLYLVRLPTNCGIGVAVQTGYLFANRSGAYRYVIQFDADGQHDVAAIGDLVRACDERQLDLCVGSRFLGQARDGFRSTWPRRIGIRFFARLIRLLTGAVVTDPTSGLRCAGPRAWRHFAVSYPDDYPEPESLFWCLRNKLRVGEVSVRMHERQAGRSSIRAWKPAYYMLKVTLAILIEILRRKEHGTT